MPAQAPMPTQSPMSVPQLAPVPTPMPAPQFAPVPAPMPAPAPMPTPTLAPQTGGANNNNALKPTLNNNNNNNNNINVATLKSNTNSSKKQTNSQNAIPRNANSIAQANASTGENASTSENASTGEQTNTNTVVANNLSTINQTSNKSPNNMSTVSTVSNANNSAFANITSNNAEKLNPLILKFKQFVNTYSKMANLDPEKLDAFNMSIFAASAFKSSVDYDLSDAQDAKFHISEKDFENFCINNSTDSVISINLDDEKFSELVNIYKDMKKQYINNCETLLSTLETSILTKLPAVDGDTNIKFTLKNISYGDLVEQETKVRNQLGKMYNYCHEQYQAGIVSLYTAFTKTT
jgi:hypothetical protein